MPQTAGGSPSYLGSALKYFLGAGLVVAATIATITTTNLKITEQATPALSAAGSATVYADSTAHNLQVSQNGGAYAPFGGTSFANPTASSTGAAINGVAVTAMRSDASPLINLDSAHGGTGVNNAGTLTNASNTTILNGGTLNLGGFTLTVPATGTAAELSVANAFTAANTWSTNATTSFTIPQLSGTFTGVRTNVTGAGAGVLMTSADDSCAYGDSVLKGLTTGDKNTAFGSSAGAAAGAGAMNDFCGFGYHAGLVNTSGRSTFVGSEAGNATTTATDSTAIGYRALYTNISGNDNTAVGDTALRLATSTGNTAVGSDCLSGVSSGAGNTGFGLSAGNGITTSGFNVAVGGLTLGANCAQCVAVGYGAGQHNTGTNNLFAGESAGSQNVAAIRVTALGDAALYAQTGANDNDNTAVGFNAGTACNGSASGNNTFVGSKAGLIQTTAINNTIVGAQAAASILTTGSGNSIFGKGVLTNASGTSNAILFGTGAGVVKGDTTSIIACTQAITSTQTGDFYLGTNDTGVNRVAAGVLRPNTGNGGTAIGYIQDGGTARNTGNVTNATATMSNLSDLTINVTSGRKYVGRMMLICKNSTGAEGLQFDLGGGSANTFTSIQFLAEETPIGATLGVTTSSAYQTALTNTVVATGDEAYCIAITIVPSSTGTLIPRFAEVSHTTGTATVELGSFIELHDSQN